MEVTHPQSWWNRIRVESVLRLWIRTRPFFSPTPIISTPGDCNKQGIMVQSNPGLKSGQNRVNPISSVIISYGATKTLDKLYQTLPGGD